MDEARWIVAGLVGALAVYGSVVNWWIVILQFTRPHAPSSMPPLFGLLAIGAVFLAPSTALRARWYLAFVLDPGFVLLLAAAAHCLWQRARDR